MRFIFTIIVFVGTCISFYGCKHDPVDYQEPLPQITLRWNKAYETETIDQVVIGLNWTLANVGAKYEIPFRIENGNQILLNVDDLGFSVKAERQFKRLHEKIKNTEEYKHWGAIDLGRYVTLILGASEHYYTINQVPERLSEVMNRYQLEQESGYVTNSGISSHHRIISFSKQVGWSQFFLSKETDSLSGNILEYETIEIMENGHLKFGVYDVDSNRVNVADPLFSGAGKPAKCMWCHESKISPLFNPQKSISGYLTYLQFKDSLDQFALDLKQKQFQNKLGIDFSQVRDHTQMELLYISFMNPSAIRLANEWGMSISAVESKLQGLSTVSNLEHPFLGKLYQRIEIKYLAPYLGAKVSTSVREFSVEEVNYIE
jgi:hypothetical protein